MPLDLINEEHDYKKKNIVICCWKRTNQYLDILVLIGPVYIDRKKNRKWWYEIRQERQKDIQTERDVHDG